MKSETDLLYMLIEAVPFQLPGVRVFRRHIINALTEIEGRRFFQKSGIKGQADAYALTRGGQHIELETKAAKGKMLAAQKSWRTFCSTWAIPYLELRAKVGESPETTVNRWIEELRVVVTRKAA